MDILTKILEGAKPPAETLGKKLKNAPAEGARILARNKAEGLLDIECIKHVVSRLDGTEKQGSNARVVQMLRQLQKLKELMVLEEVPVFEPLKKGDKVWVKYAFGSSVDEWVVDSIGRKYIYVKRRLEDEFKRDFDKTKVDADGVYTDNSYHLFRSKEHAELILQDYKLSQKLKDIFVGLSGRMHSISVRDKRRLLLVLEHLFEP